MGSGTLHCAWLIETVFGSPELLPPVLVGGGVELAVLVARELSCLAISALGSFCLSKVVGCLGVGTLFNFSFCGLGSSKLAMTVSPCLLYTSDAADD